MSWQGDIPHHMVAALFLGGLDMGTTAPTTLLPITPRLPCFQ